MLLRDENGKVMKTRDNFLIILRNDPHFKQMFKYNEFSEARECHANGRARGWTDADDAQVRCYIERTYHLSDNQRLEDAMTVVFEENRYHPVQELVKSIGWDGMNRLDGMLIKYFGCADDAYSREVSRIIFHSGILRLFEPGCKADYMPVLIGIRQGEGKSTFVRLLNMRDDWFREVAEFEGQRGMEAIEGGWVCEVSELLALKRTREAGAVKAYLTRQSDNYRRPYAKYVSTNPRKCIFIGTTNTEQFLNDPTGGRRYLPIQVQNRNLYDHLEEFKADVRQCWAEAYADYLAGKASAVETPGMYDIIRAHQEEAKEDDWRVGMMAEYLKGQSVVCVKQLWEEALQMKNPPTKRDSQEIATLMQNFPEWVREKKAKKIPGYGTQKVWVNRNFIPEKPPDFDDL